MLFISDVQFYVPIKLCKTPGSIHLFKITGIDTGQSKDKSALCLGHFRSRLERG